MNIARQLAAKLGFFRRIKGTGNQETNSPEMAKSKVTRHPAERQAAINFFYGCTNDIRAAGQHLNAWRDIPPVICKVPFPGWGYVEGATRGIEINSRLFLVEGDQDMSYTCIVVLIDMLPCLILRADKGRLTATIIAGQNYFNELARPSGRPFNTTDEFNDLPPKVQEILDAILFRMYSLADAKLEPIEKILSY